jgi:phosphoglycolate phosphatase
MLVNFDYDGVLVDSLDRLCKLAVRAQQETGAGRAPTVDDFRYLKNMAFADLARCIGIDDGRVWKFCETALRLQEMEPSLPPLFEGAPEMIRSVSKNATVTVISSSSKSEIEKVLKGAGVLPCVRTIFDGADYRPKSEKIKEAMMHFSEAAAATYMVGDSRSDIVQGKLAGVRTIAVAWGYQPRDLLAQEEPDFLVDDITELVELLTAQQL